QLRLWEYPAARLIAELPFDDGSFDLAFSPDGRLLAATAADDTVLYELPDRGVQGNAAGGTDSILACALHPHGRSLSTLSMPNHGMREVAVWPIDSGAAAPALRYVCVPWAYVTGEPSQALAFAPDSQRLAYRQRLLDSTFHHVIVRDGAGLTRPLELKV